MPKPPEPLVVLRMREFKALLLARENAQMEQMARRWLDVERALDAQIYALAMEAKQLQDAGVTISKKRLFDLQRYRTLRAQVRDETAAYAQYTERIVTSGQASMAALGIDNAQETIQLSYWQHSRIPVFFNRLPIEAVENMVGIAGDGGPLGALIRQRMITDSDAMERLTRSLIEGTALGRNPRDTAEIMRTDLTGGLDKALVIARTEQLRVYRQASAAQYQASGVVTGQKRLTAHDSRVCPACLADEGHVYPINVSIPDHPNGRCTGVPVVKGLPEVKWLGGEAWFKTQDEATQRAILGNGRYDAWKSGSVNFGQFTRLQHNDVWGDNPQTPALSELLSAGTP